MGVVLAPAAGAQTTAPPPVQPEPTETPPVDAHADDPTDVLGFMMDDISGEAAPLEAFRGKVVVFVNVASRCGLTPQYEGLEALYEKYKDRGLVILGFPANNFGGQEPGTNQEIREFCTGTYSVTFPMFSKISVKGDDQHALYAKLALAMKDQGGEPTWNFTKYVVDRTGHVVRRFEPRTAPDDAALVGEIEKLLDQPAPKPETKDRPA